MTACLVTAIVQTPMLFCISNLLNGADHWSPYIVVMFIAGLQFVSVCFYFMMRGLKPFEVKKESIYPLAIRSVLYCFAINMFVYTLERLNPASALMALHSGIIATTCIIRFVMAEQMFFTLTVIKVC